jgi:hypothetical protein
MNKDPMDLAIYDADLAMMPFGDLWRIKVRRFSFAISFLILALACPAAQAQAPAPAQAKLKLYVSVEGLDPDARECGVTEQTLRSPAVSTLRNNRIDIVNDRTLPYLSVKPNVMALASGNHCVYSLEIAIRDEDAPKVRSGFKTKRASSVFLCKQESLWIVPKLDVPKKLSESVEQLLKLCLNNIDY